MSEMKKVIGIIKELENETSLNKKIEILRKNKDNELLKKVIEYAYNPYKVYKVNPDRVRKYINKKQIFFAKPSIEDVFKYFDYLVKLDSVKSKDVSKFGVLLSAFDDDEIDLFLRILSKDLKCGINVGIINKVFEGLVPEFDVMLAESMDKLDEFLKRNDKFYVNYKYDGVRLITFIDVEKGNVEFWSRNGKRYYLPFLENDILNNFDIKKLVGEHDGIKRVMLDGELVLGEDINEFQGLMTIVRKKNIQFDDLAKIEKKVKYWIFDCVINEGTNTVLRGRLIWLSSFFEEYGLSKSKFCRQVKYWVRSSRSDVLNDLEDALSKGYEGLILKSIDGIYHKGRSIEWVKVKKFDTIDAVVVDIIEGQGKYKNMVGSLVCETEDGIKFNVGSGLNDELRKRWWNNPNEILGKVIEVKYQELTRDQVPRFPIFVGVREDKSF